MSIESKSEGDLFSLLDRLTSNMVPIVVATKSPSEHHQGVQPFMPNHAYSVIGFDKLSGMVMSHEVGLIHICAGYELALTAKLASGSKIIS